MNKPTWNEAIKVKNWIVYKDSTKQEILIPKVWGITHVEAMMEAYMTLGHSNFHVERLDD